MPAVNTNASSPPKRGRQHPGIQPYAVDEMVDGQHRAGIGIRLQLPHVVADAGQAFEAAVAIEQVLDGRGLHAFFGEQVEQHPGIDLARPRAHGYPVERGETHRAFDAAAVGQGAHGRAAAEMSDDDSARRHAWGDLAQAPGDVFVRQTVETVSPDTLGVEALRNGKVVRNRTVAVMKGGIEAGNLKQFRSTHQQRPDRCEVVRLMQGCEGNVLLETRDHALVDDHRPVIFRPAMDDPVANRDEVEALGLPEPSRHHGNRRGNVGDLVRRIAPIDQR